MRRAIVTLAAVIGLLLGGTFLIPWTLRPNAVAGPCTVVSGPAALPELPESSGLAVSRRTPGLLWSHNDSGNAAVLFAIEPNGTMRGRVAFPIATRDWEDVSAANCSSGPCLYIADIGDNGSRRKQVAIYRVPEPLPGDTGTARPETFRATYADGPHNAESLFVIGVEMFIVTRDQTGSLYHASATRPGAITFQKISELGIRQASDAEASPDEQTVVVRNSREALYYRAADLIRGGTVPYRRLSISEFREAQGEGIAIDGDMLYLSSEGGAFSSSGSIISLRCNFSSR